MFDNRMSKTDKILITIVFIILVLSMFANGKFVIVLGGG